MARGCDMEHTEFTQASEALLFAPEFQELAALLEFREPNLWHILGISRRETRMSRFLAWLLDPQGGHSFGDQFLKNLLVQALRTEAGRKWGVTPVEVLVMDLSNVQVRIEHRLGKRRCDIVVFSPGADGGDGFFCLIENKIAAGEGRRQTKDYYEASLVAFPPEQFPHRVYIYLTPAGEPPEDENFIPVSYQAIPQAIQDLQAKRKLTKTEQFLLQQFEDSITRGIAMDPNTVDLAQSIYDQHRDVFEFVLENVDRSTEGEPPLPEPTWDGKSRFFNVGEMAGSGYRWDDCHQFGFICAGGGKRHRRLMERLKAGDAIFAYVSGWGYVGVGAITDAAVPFREAKLDDGRRMADLDLAGMYDDSADDDNCDWVARVRWRLFVEKNDAVRERLISPATSCRIYDHWKDLIEEIESELRKKVDLVALPEKR